MTTAADYRLHNNVRQVAIGLTYAGTLPFIAAALAPTFSVGGIDLSSVICIYATAIISFISGTHWAFHLGQQTPHAWKVIVTSNIATLSALALYLFASDDAALIGYIALFAGVFAIDKAIVKSAAEPAWFYTLRRNATSIVIVSLLGLLLQ